MPEGDEPSREDFSADAWDEAAAEDFVDPDVLFDALADPTRRRVAQHLDGAGDATIEELADVVVGWRLSRERVIEAAERERVLTALHHSHLPKLADAGLLRYDSDGRMARAETAAPVWDVVRVACEYANHAAAGAGE
jgi:DNA-binding transcriptional ArsR family regulator